MSYLRRLRDHHEEVEDLAHSWLRSGAQAFGVYVRDEPIWTWGTSGNDLPEAAAPIQVDGVSVGEIRLQGLPPEQVEQQLRSEGRLLGKFINIEHELRMMTSALVDVQDQLLSMYQLAGMSNQRMPVRDVLEQMARQAADLFHVEGVFALVDTHAWPLIVEHYPRPLIGMDPLHNYRRRIAGGEAIIRWQASEDKANTSEAPAPDVNGLLIVSANIHEEGYVSLGLVNKDGEDFTLPDVKLARAIAENGGAQLENLMLHERAMEQTRLRTEMELAQSVQLNLLPHQSPDVQGLEIWADSRPASRVGGDFYDFAWGRKHNYTFAVGDVSGKGVPAAMLMAMTRAVIRANLEAGHTASPEMIIRRAHGALYSDFARVGMFATVFIAQFDVENRELVYANAGHSPVIFCPRREAPRILKADGTPMGVLPETDSRDHWLRIGRGDILVVATDGFNESWDNENTMFGYQRLLDLIDASRHRPAPEIGRNLYNAVQAFRNDRLQEDDQTVIVIKGVQPE